MARPHATGRLALAALGALALALAAGEGRTEWELSVVGRERVHVRAAANVTCCTEGRSLDEWWLESPLPVEEGTLAAYDARGPLRAWVAPTGAATGLVVGLRAPLLAGEWRAVGAEHDAVVDMARSSPIWSVAALFPVEGGGLVRVRVEGLGPRSFRLGDGGVFAPTREGNVTVSTAGPDPPSATITLDGALEVELPVAGLESRVVPVSVAVAQPLSCPSGATCESDPDGCACPAGWSCRASSPASTARGCYSERCGNGVCDAGECAAGCRDCGAASCAGDGACTAAVGERCDTAADCRCPPSSICDPRDARADGQGCLSPSCSDDVCDFAVTDRSNGTVVTFGECALGCAGCNATMCARDPACNLRAGERCDTSSDCPCPAGSACDPKDRRANATGCYARSCWDGVCDAGECAAGCRDCGLSDCLADAACNTRSGEDCSTAPSQCACPAGWTCKPGAGGATEIGCYNERCGNGACERELGECAGRCRDCREEDCLGDGECSAFYNETCSSSVDCACEEGLLCEPEREGADERGCAAPSCGDGRCEGGEGGGSCPRDCGAAEEQLISVPAEPVVVRSRPNATATLVVPVRNGGASDVKVRLVAWGDAGPWLSLEEAEPTLFKGAARELYANVSVPPDATAGLHQGKLELQRAGEASLFVPFAVDVSESGAYCGDGACQEGEDCSLCPKDCACVPAIELEVPASATATAGVPGSFPVRLRNTGGVELHDVGVELVGVPGSLDRDRIAALAPGDGASLVASFTFEEEGTFSARVAVTTSEGPSDKGEVSIAVGSAAGASKGLGDDIAVERARLSVELGRFAALKERSAGELSGLGERLERHLTRAQDELEAAQELVAAGDLVEAQAHLVQARTELDAYGSLAPSPGEGGRDWRAVLGLALALVALAVAGMAILAWKRRPRPSRAVAGAAPPVQGAQRPPAAAQQAAYGQYQGSRPLYRYEYWQRPGAGGQG